MSALTDFTYLYEQGHDDDLFVNLAANASNFVAFFRIFFVPKTVSGI